MSSVEGPKTTFENNTREYEIPPRFQFLSPGCLSVSQGAHCSHQHHSAWKLLKSTVVVEQDM